MSKKFLLTSYSPSTISIAIVQLECFLLRALLLGILQSEVSPARRNRFWLSVMGGRWNIQVRLRGRYRRAGDDTLCKNKSKMSNKILFIQGLQLISFWDNRFRYWRVLVENTLSAKIKKKKISGNVLCANGNTSSIEFHSYNVFYKGYSLKFWSYRYAYGLGRKCLIVYVILTAPAASRDLLPVVSVFACQITVIFCARVEPRSDWTNNILSPFFPLKCPRGHCITKYQK